MLDKVTKTSFIKKVKLFFPDCEAPQLLVKLIAALTISISLDLL